MSNGGPHQKIPILPPRIAVAAVAPRTIQYGSCRQQIAGVGPIKLMRAGSLVCFVSRGEGISLSPGAGFRLCALRWLLCIIVSAGTPDLAWGQYSSGGYSRPGGGSSSGYSAPSRRAPVTSSGGYSRRSYSGAGYATGSFGDRAVSRSLSSQAFRKYQTAQPAPETHARRADGYV